MKKSKFLTVLAIPFLVAGCSQEQTSSSSPTSGVEPHENTRVEVDVKMASNFADTIGEGEFTAKCVYDDDWFFKDSSKINYELALASAMTGGASYANDLDKTGKKITDFLEATGFSNIERNYYYENALTLTDSMGAIIGEKTIYDKNGQDYTLLAVFPRNAGYFNEWYGNFNIATNGVHTGFMLARDEVVRFMKHYISHNEIKGKLKVWTAGYSRGAATINLFGGFLADGSSYFGDDVSLSVDDIYAYTIATPSTIPMVIDKNIVLSVSDPRGGDYHDTDVKGYEYTAGGRISPISHRYDFVHNFVAVGDYVTKLPLSDWGFTRYGLTEDIVFGEEKMLSYLKEISPSTAAMFDGGRSYVTEEPTKTFNFDTFEVEDGETKMSPNEVFDSHIKSLLNLVPNVEELITKGYIDVVASLVAAAGCDTNAFMDGIKNTDKATLVKALAFTYISEIAEEQELSDAEATSNLVMDLFGLLGKDVGDHESYTDQQFLKDVFDLLINDYQKDEASKERLEKLVSLIPGAYGQLFLKLAKYADENHITVTYVDDLLFLVASFFNANKEDEDIQQLLSNLVDIIPTAYYSIIWSVAKINRDDYEDDKSATKAAVGNILTFCVEGYDDLSAAGFRYSLLSIAGFGLSGCPKLIDLVFNGATDSNGQKVVREPHKLSETMEEFLKVALKDSETGEVPSLKEAANENLIAVLTNCESDKNRTYVNGVKEKIEQFKDVLMAFLFDHSKGYSLKADIDRVLTFYNSITFLAPSHFSEMYYCYLKSKQA